MPEEILKQDKAFYQSLRDYLAQFSEGMEPIVPVMFSIDGTIDRVKTLNFPCFANYVPEAVEGEQALHR